jgi:hypothetical protein
MKTIIVMFITITGQHSSIAVPGFDSINSCMANAPIIYQEYKCAANPKWGETWCGIKCVELNK